MAVYTLQNAYSPNPKKIKHMKTSVLILSDVFLLFQSYAAARLSPASKRKENGYSHPATSVVGRDFNLDFT